MSNVKCKLKLYAHYINELCANKGAISHSRRIVSSTFAKEEDLEHQSYFKRCASTRLVGWVLSVKGKSNFYFCHGKRRSAIYRFKRNIPATQQQQHITSIAEEILKRLELRRGYDIAPENYELISKSNNRKRNTRGKRVLLLCKEIKVVNPNNPEFPRTALSSYDIGSPYLMI
ncbi:hypothetical protein DINM_004101 [Dirofilaria immitis]|nr:hypothetical protein [Dirofilaria immitis]